MITNKENKMQQIIQEKNIRLCYFMVKTNKGIGYICMSLSRPEKGSDSHIYRAGFSFCSPQEGKKFSKQKARSMALGRLATFGREDEHNRIEFTSYAENINQVFTDGLFEAENTKVKESDGAFASRVEGRIMSEWVVPNWVRNRKGLIFGLNVNGPMTEAKALKA
jgi:hypothetical protein